MLMHCHQFLLLKEKKLPKALIYRDDKLNMLQPIFDQFTDYTNKRMELETKIAEVFFSPVILNILFLYC